MNWHNSPHHRTFDEVPSNVSNNFIKHSIEQSKLHTRYGISKSTLSHRISKLGLKTYKEGRCCYLTNSQLELLDELHSFLLDSPGSKIDDFLKSSNVPRYSSNVPRYVEQHKESHLTLVDTPLKRLEYGLEESNNNNEAQKSVLPMAEISQQSFDGVSNNSIERSMDAHTQQELQQLRNDLQNANKRINELEGEKELLSNTINPYKNYSNKLSEENEKMKSQLIQLSMTNSYLTSRVSDLENDWNQLKNDCNQLKVERDAAIEKEKAWTKHYNECIKPVNANPVTNVVQLVPGQQ
jgi:DNA repair exonuclease SbcCD ATPase subunit